MLAQPKRGTYEIIQTAYKNPTVPYECLRKNDKDRDRGMIKHD